MKRIKYKTFIQKLNISTKVEYKLGNVLYSKRRKKHAANQGKQYDILISYSWVNLMYPMGFLMKKGKQLVPE